MVALWNIRRGKKDKKKIEEETTGRKYAMQGGHK